MKFMIFLVITVVLAAVDIPSDLPHINPIGDHYHPIFNAPNFPRTDSSGNPMYSCESGDTTGPGDSKCNIAECMGDMEYHAPQWWRTQNNCKIQLNSVNG